MSRTIPGPARPLAVLFAVVLVVFSLGMIGPAGATTFTGQGDDHRSATADANADTAPDAPDARAAQGSNAKNDTASDNGGGANATSAEVKNNDDRHTPMGEQPVSGADQNTGGANGQCSDTEPDAGYFCGTVRDKPSGNGQGGGQAVGKPWQAHVGKADNKNPPGQSENDSNNGYECDGNQGIAKGNPAHTSCAPETPGECIPTEENDFCGEGGECIPTVENDFCGEGEGEECVPTPTKPCAPGKNRPPTVRGVEQLAPPAGVQQVAGPAGVLPSTGAAAFMDTLAATGFGLLVLGAVTLLFRRRAHQG